MTMPSIAKFDIWQNTAGIPYNIPIQIVTATHLGETALTTTTDTYLTGLEISITPKFANSKLYVYSTMDIRNNTNTDGGATFWYKSVGGGAYSYVSGSTCFYYATGNAHRRHVTDVIDLPATTSSITYRIYARSWSGGTSNFNYSTLGLTGKEQVCKMIIYEIAQ